MCVNLYVCACVCVRVRVRVRVLAAARALYARTLFSLAILREQAKPLEKTR